RTTPALVVRSRTTDPHYREAVRCRRSTRRAARARRTGATRRTWDHRPMSVPAIPRDLLPADGRFGSGPSRIRPAQVDTLAALGSTLLGTSHRQDPVRHLVGRAREGLATPLGSPEGYEVVLGNGGSTAFWDLATFSLLRQRVQHATCGEFGAKFAAASAAAPFLAEPQLITADPGSAAVPVAEPGIDTYAWTHNETSTGVLTPVVRPQGADAD